MAAPKGNRYWERRKVHGKDKKYKTPNQLWQGCIRYFEWVEDNPLMATETVKFQGEATLIEVPKMRAMTLAGLCLHLKIDPKTWASYRTDDDYLPITTRVEEIIWEQKFSGAAAELLNPNIIARELGLAEKKEVNAELTQRFVVSDTPEITVDEWQKQNKS